MLTAVSLWLTFGAMHAAYRMRGLLSADARRKGRIAMERVVPEWSFETIMSAAMLIHMALGPVGILPYVLAPTDVAREMTTEYQRESERERRAQPAVLPPPIYPYWSHLWELPAGFRLSVNLMRPPTWRDIWGIRSQTVMDVSSKRQTRILTIMLIPPLLLTFWK